MAGTSLSTICIDPLSSPGSGNENLTLLPAKLLQKVVKLRGQEYRIADTGIALSVTS